MRFDSHQDGVLVDELANGVDVYFVVGTERSMDQLDLEVAGCLVERGVTGNRYDPEAR
jgi:hypothetical protein